MIDVSCNRTSVNVRNEHIVTFRYTMQSNHQINHLKMYDTNIYINANYNNNNINDSIYMHYVIAL